MTDETPTTVPRPKPTTTPSADRTPSSRRCAPKLAALKDQALRVAAEAENTKRRAEREANDARAYAIQKFARDLLGVADNLAARAAARADATPATRWSRTSPSAWR